MEGQAFMTLVIFFLTIHLTVACLFVLTFAFVSLQERSHEAPRWFTAAFTCSAAMPLFGFWFPTASQPNLFIFGAFTALMAAVTAILIGLYKTYKQKPDWWLIGLTFVISLIANALVFDVPRSDLLHRFLQHFPLCVIDLLMIRVIWRSGMPRTVDKLLLGLCIISFMHFFSKIFLIIWPGADLQPEQHVEEGKMLLSLSMGVVTHAATGLLLLLRTLSRMVGDASEQSEVDALSQIYNRRGFDNHVAYAFTRNGPDMPYAIIMCDLDHFKNVNDTLGHDGGDQVIAFLGQLLRAHLPKSAISARMGGEEFVVFLPKSDLNQAYQLAQKIRTELQSANLGATNSDVLALNATASFGVAVHIADEALYETMRRADRALYDAKRAGRNRVHTAEGQLSDVSRSTARQPISLR